MLIWTHGARHYPESRIDNLITWSMKKISVSSAHTKVAPQNFLRIFLPVPLTTTRTGIPGGDN